jgi:aldoxime dehydratase
MESAIPQHLAVARSRPSRVPEDFVPAYPSFVARTAGAVRQVAMAYLGAVAGPVPDRTGLLDLAGRAPDPVRSPSPPASSA